MDILREALKKYCARVSIRFSGACYGRQAYIWNMVMNLQDFIRCQAHFNGLTYFPRQPLMSHQTSIKKGRVSTVHVELRTQYAVIEN
jgi:hypothetical protein